MDNVNLAAVEEYSQSYAKRLSNYFFIDHELITGKQILKFSEIHQINLFVIASIFDQWQEETAHFKSPYFDYEAEEVKEALKVFMDTVSRHMAIRKETFEPLLAQAVRHTLLLILAPHQYFEQWFSKTLHVSLTGLQERLKYFQVNKVLLSKLIERLEVSGEHLVTANQALDWVKELQESHPEQLENPEKYMDLFSNKLPLETSTIFVVATAPEKEPEPAPEPKAEEVILPTPAISTPPEKKKEASVEVSLNERFSREQPTFNDSLRQSAAKDSLLERHLKTRIENIKSAIPLNQKFVFINELFRGDTAAYHQALNELEQCENYQAATQLLRDNYAKTYGWNMDGEEVEAFFEIIERKFY